MFTVRTACCLFLVFVLSSCQQRKTSTKKPNYYFSVEEYFHKEAQRLSKQGSLIVKAVSRNAIGESKEVDINDWEKEFGLYIESDINKLSWKDSYQVLRKGDSTVYQSLDSTLRTQKILLVRENQEIKEVLIENKVSNLLYTSSENLSYYPDSLYLIQKEQKVRFLGTNAYEISGHFKP